MLLLLPNPVLMALPKTPGLHLVYHPNQSGYYQCFLVVGTQGATEDAERIMTVTKKDLTAHVADTTGLKARESKQLVEGFFDTIRETLASGEEVQLSGFGRFNILDKRARPGRNPKNGKFFEIEARRVVTFTASLTLKHQCNPGHAGSRPANI